MTGGLRQRTLLTPAGHPAIDQPRIARQDDIRSEAQTFHDTRPEPFDQRIGAFEQAEHLCDGSLRFDIDLDHASAAAGY